MRFGGTGEVAAFHPGVVLGADAGEHRDLLAAQPFDAPVAEGGQTGLLRVILARRLARNSRTSLRFEATAVPTSKWCTASTRI
jgi:hypothetical protein